LVSPPRVTGSSAHFFQHSRRLLANLRIIVIERIDHSTFRLGTPNTTQRPNYLKPDIADKVYS
jgi:hypothetical protein